jgi:CPA1 family monovalent cation:H+ antiporter
MFDVAASLLVLTALLAALNQRVLRLPPTIGLMAMALALTLALVGLDAAGIAPGWSRREAEFVAGIDFSQLLMQGMLSLLLFASAMHVDAGALRAYRWQVAVLAFASTAGSTVLVGFAMAWAGGHLGLQIPLLHWLLFGALVSPTDPIAVLGMLKSARAPRNLEAVIAGESLFNDGVGVVLFTLLLGMASGDDRTPLADGALLLLRQAGGGLVFGWLLGAITLWVLRRLGNPVVEVLVTLAAVVGGYALASHLQASGPLAMVVAGLMVGRACADGTLPGTTRDHLGMFWGLADELLNAVLFVLVGLQFIAIRMPGGPGVAALACASAILVVLGARWVTVGLPVRVFSAAFRLPPGAPLVLTWGGLRGGISIALALSLPAVAHRDTLIALTYAIVAFAVLVQGLTFARLLRATGGETPPIPAR